MMFDPMYFLFIAPAFLLSLWASWQTKATFKKYSKSGRDRADRRPGGARLLEAAGISDVTITRARGMLSDHYNPVTKTLALSEGVYGSRSIAAVGVAAHEAGHAIQHAQHYAPLWLRSMLVPTANIGSTIGYFVMLIGLFMSSRTWCWSARCCSRRCCSSRSSPCRWSSTPPTAPKRWWWSTASSTDRAPGHGPCPQRRGHDLRGGGGVVADDASLLPGAGGVLGGRRD